MHKEKFIFILLFFILLNGCKTEITKQSPESAFLVNSEESSKDKTQQALYESSSYDKQKMTAEKTNKDIFERKNFSIGKTKFSVCIPKGLDIGDYTKISRSLSLINVENDHSLIITIREFDGKKLLDIKNELTNGDGNVKATVFSWRKNGYEITFKRSNEKKDYMLIINRTFLLPYKNIYFVLNETVGAQEDNSLSKKIKVIADSLII